MNKASAEKRAYLAKLGLEIGINAAYTQTGVDRRTIMSSMNEYIPEYKRRGKKPTMKSTMKSHSERSEWWFIYALSDPRDGQVRYVGITAQPTPRFNSHMHGNTHPDLFAWIKEVRDFGDYPCMTILEVGYGRRQGEVRELFWISEASSWGQKVMNVYGGHGVRRKAGGELPEEIRRARFGPSVASL